MSWCVEEEGLLRAAMRSLRGPAGCSIYSALGVSTHHKLFDMTEGCAFYIRLSLRAPPAAMHNS